MQLFKKLNHSEIQEFIDWANENYEPFSPIDSLWHPVVVAQCKTINLIASKDVIVTTGGEQ